MKLKKLIQENRIAIFSQKNINVKFVSWGIVCGLLSFVLLVGVIAGYTLKSTIINQYVEGFYAIPPSEEKFSEENLKKMLLEINIRHPKVVFAQAKLETFNFKSQIFQENHNLFGMKMPSVRTTTAKGEQYSHAIYSNWKESVLDYALRQCRYGSNIDSDEDYIKYLGSTYAEDPDYEKKLIEIYNQVKL